METRQRVLFVTTYDPSRSELGGAAWVDRRIIGTLRQAFEVHVHPLTEGQTALPLSVRGDLSATTHTLTRMALRGEPYQAAKLRFHRNFEAKVRELSGLSSAYDYVVSSQWPALLLLAHAGMDVDLHLAHNVDWVLSRQHDPMPLRLLRNAARLKRVERRLLGRPKRVVTLSRADALRLRDVGVLASAVRLAEPRSLDVHTEHRAVGVLGKMSWPPNRDAVMRMRDQILPDLNARLAQPVRLIIAGHGSRALARGNEVDALGVVAEPRDFYDQVDVVVLPRVETQRSGVSIKLLEAVEAGKLVVAPETLYADCGLSSPWSTELGGVEAITDALHTLYVDAPRDDLAAPSPTEGSDWISLGDLGHMLDSRPSGTTEAGRSIKAKLVSSMDELLTSILSETPTRVQTLNLHHLYLARTLPDFRRAVAEADHVTADGWPVKALLRRKLDIDATRVTGADFLPELVGDARMAGKRVALIGGSEEAAEVFRARLEAVGAELANGWHGARREWDPADLARRISADPVDIVIVAVTPPYGELLAADLRRRGVKASIIAVGGALDMLVGQRRRAPEIVQRIGMEWLYRMAQDPKALMRRYLVECIPELVRLWLRPRGPLL